MGESVSSIRTDRINVNSNGINDSVKNSNEAANNSEVKKLESEEISIDIDVDDSNEDVYELMALDESEVENMKNRVSMFSKYIDGANEYKNLIDSIYENLNFKDKLRFKVTDGNQCTLTFNYSQFINDPIIISLMQKYFTDASALDCIMYFGAFNNVGCGYTTFINTIFEYFKGQEYAINMMNQQQLFNNIKNELEKEVKDKFGIPCTVLIEKLYN